MPLFVLVLYNALSGGRKEGDEHKTDRFQKRLGRGKEFWGRKTLLQRRLCFGLTPVVFWLCIRVRTYTCEQAVHKSP